jgi:type VI secretion system secreted protein VgrG
MEALSKRAKTRKKANPRQQITVLQRRIASVEKEVAVLKSAIKIANGTMRVTIETEKREAIGANELIEIGGNSQHRIGRSRTETVASNRTVTVGADQVETIGGDLSLQVGGNTTQQSGRNVNLTAGKQFLIAAADEITLKAGQASIVLKKNGAISIRGSNIRAEASGDLVLKGARIQQN